jgi:hypothetical protein
MHELWLYTLVSWVYQILAQISSFIEDHPYVIWFRHQAWALLNHWHYFNCFSFLISSFDSSIINLSVYPEQITGEHYCLLFFVFKMVDCSGESFRMSILYSFCNINHHIKMIAFLSATKACRSKWLYFSRSFTLASSSIIFCSGDFDIQMVFYFPSQSYQIL